MLVAALLVEIGEMLQGPDHTLEVVPLELDHGSEL